MAYGLETLSISNFEAYLTAHGFDAQSSGEIVSYLAGLGYTSSVTLDEEVGPPFQGPASAVQVDVSLGGVTDFATGSGGNAPGYMLLDAHDAFVTVSGSADVAVSAATGNTQYNLEGSGKEQAFLGTGNDTVWVGNNNTPGATGADTIYGGSGNETYAVGSSATTGAVFHAGSGSNVFWDFSSVNNTYYGDTAPGAGSDSIYLHGSGNDTIYAGSGTDTYDGSNANNPGGIDAAFSTGHNSLIAGTGNDVLIGSVSGGTDTMVGGVGQDSLYAGTNGDVLESGSGSGGYNLLADFRGLAGGSNTLDGSTGHGNDLLYAAGAANDVLKSGSGSDTLDATTSTGNNTFDITGSGDNTIKTGSGESTINASGATGNNLYQLYGPVSGSGGGVVATLGNGSDTVDVGTNGGAGFSLTDSITAGSGQDFVDFIGLNQSAASISTIAGVTTVHFGAESVVVTASSAPGSDITLRFSDGSTYNAG
jgi:Ca2+-binding RTX toxin-like protein